MTAGHKLANEVCLPDVLQFVDRELFDTLDRRMVACVVDQAVELTESFDGECPIGDYAPLSCEKARSGVYKIDILKFSESILECFEA